MDIFEERIDTLSMTEEAPLEEPNRQYYFIRKMRDIVAKKQAEKNRPLTMHVATFGCQMNAKDSEKLCGVLSSIGYVETEDENADLVLYNTCTVRENANMRVYGRIGYLGACKKKNPDMKIALCGCMMQEPQVVEKLKKSYRFVDLIFGTHNIYMLAELLYQREQTGKMVVSILEESTQIVEELPAERKFSFKAGVNIMYGCNNFCSYCIVPYVRGRERSRDVADIVSEVRNLSESGVKEVMLLGQNVNSYGKTLETPVSFAKLLHEVCEVPGILRVRFMTPHPKDLSEELIEEIARSKKVCRQIHLPLQSGSTSILKAMNRHYTKDQYLALTDRIKERIPDAAITTDIIVGFPGETEEDFKETLDVVERVGYISAYTFEYSKRSGTPAAEMENQVPEEVVKERFGRLLETVNRRAHAKAQEATGKTVEVLVEEQNPESMLLTGRLDNSMLVHFAGEPELLGNIVRVKLSECKGFYYLGELA